MLILLCGCRSTPTDFSLFFTVESVDIYTLSLEIQKDKFYYIRQQNIYLDKNDGQEHISTSQGIMSEEDFANLRQLIAKSSLFNLKDSYGFDQEDEKNDPLSDLVYQLTYTQGKKNKFITLRLKPDDKYPESLIQLIQFLSQFTSKNLVKTD
jgi:hypothetical protein